jgi:hypothetical protein
MSEIVRVKCPFCKHLFERNIMNKVYKCPRCMRSFNTIGEEV